MTIEYKGIPFTIVMPFNIGHEVTLTLNLSPQQILRPTLADSTELESFSLQIHLYPQ